jgi:hypothetical protein
LVPISASRKWSMPTGGSTERSERTSSDATKELTDKKK